jgi:peptide/nickel transport system substrate-binding protein
MASTLNKRLFFWLIAAYVRKWGKIILLSFVVGLIVFFLLITLFPVLIRLFPGRRPIIGIAGIYTLDNIPARITNKLSEGLTKVNPDGTVSPDVAKSWKVSTDGKTYEFTLDPSKTFADGSFVTSDTISYNFTGVKINRSNPHVISFTLKDRYTPFLVTTSRPIIKKNTIGIGQYRIDGIKISGGFIQSLRLTPVKNPLQYETYQFYPTEEALKTAFLLGEVNQVYGLNDIAISHYSLKNFPNLQIEKHTSTTQLVTLFFNMQDSVLSDKSLRNALSYGLPDTFPQGVRSYLPYPRSSIYFNTDLPDKKRDLEHAKLLLTTVTNNGKNPPPHLILSYASKYKDTALAIEKAWKDIGISVSLDETEQIPQTYQMYLSDFSIPKDPDQYALWHSQQPNNITHYDSERIDKFLEDGRKEPDQTKRQKFYDDFQKYLQDDSPAAFLYFPSTYSIVRK